MRRSADMHVNLNRPGSPGVAAPPPRPRPGGTSLGWHGLMDTTSNLGRGADSDCAPTSGAPRIRAMSRTDRASRPAVRMIFPEELSLSTMQLSMRPKPGASSSPNGIDLTRFRQWGSTSLPHSRPSSRQVDFLERTRQTGPSQCSLRPSFVHNAVFPERGNAAAGL
jgi:hypothetical protein